MELFFALLAVVIAFIALLTQRIHNRKEMLPVLHNYYASGYDPDTDLYTYELRLINDGRGVALIESSYVILPDGSSTHFERYAQLSKFIMEKFPECVEVYCSLPYALRGGIDDIIYKVVVPNEQDKEFKELRFVFEARSIYGDKVKTTWGQFYQYKSSTRLVREKVISEFSKFKTKFFKKGL